MAAFPIPNKKKKKSCVKPCHLLSSSPFPLPSLPFFLSPIFTIPFLPSFFFFIYFPLSVLPSYLFPLFSPHFSCLSSLSFFPFFYSPGFCLIFPSSLFLVFSSSFSPPFYSTYFASLLKDMFSAWHIISL